MIGAVWEALSSFAISWRFGRSWVSRAQFDRWQKRRIRRWLKRDLPKVRAYRGLRASSLFELPKTDKALLLEDFSAYTRADLPLKTVKAALLEGATIGSLTVGASTGTSGNRGYFVISDRERYRWLGAILAKAIPDLLLKRQRVAVILPQNTRLYESARRTRGLTLAFFDITLGPESWQDALVAFDPSIVIAPPRLLRWCAQAQLPLKLERLFSAAETLEPQDRAVIEDWSGQKLGQIYMATEGLLGVSCAAGGLHLAEDSIAFEFEEIGDGLVCPLISSFRRQEQIMARYQMNDLLRLAQAPCPCGSPLQLVEDVVGRRDDCFELFTAQGEPLLFTPDGLRNAVIASHESITDYCLVQVGPSEVELHLPLKAEEAVMECAKAALDATFARRGAKVTLSVLRQPLGFDPARKLRRVQRRLPQ